MNKLKVFLLQLLLLIATRPLQGSNQTLKIFAQEQGAGKQIIPFEHATLNEVNFQPWNLWGSIKRNLCLSKKNQTFNKHCISATMLPNAVIAKPSSVFYTEVEVDEKIECIKHQIRVQVQKENEELITIGIAIGFGIGLTTALLADYLNRKK